jgi:uncharacterized membrane protein
MTFSPMPGQGEEQMPFDLSAPRIVTFVISAVIAVVAIIIHYGHIATPPIESGFSILLLGYLVLALGTMVRGM